MAQFFQQGDFQIDQNMTPDQVKRRRERLEKMIRYGSAKTLPEGLVHLAGGFLENRKRKGLDKAEKTGLSGADDIWSRLQGALTQRPGPMAIGGVPPIEPVETRPLNDPQVIADDTMAALGQAPSSGARAGPWEGKEDIQAGIFAGESGGDYDALFGYQNRPGGKFAGVKPTDMTVGQMIDFQSPSGEYGQYVKGQVGRVATPSGAYQVVGTTLRDAVNSGVVNPNDKFDKATQDKVGAWILSTQGTGAWEGYKGPQSGGQQPQGQPQGGRVPDRTAMLYEALANPWMAPERKMVIAQMLQQEMQANDPAAQLDVDYKRAQIAKLRGEAAGGGSTEFGLTPQFITDADGNLKMIQLGKNGTINEVELPEGAAVQKGVEKLDLGTAYQWYNTVTGEPIGQPIAKNIRDAAREEAGGRVEGGNEATARIAAPEVVAKAQGMLDLIDSVIADPALPSITGNIQGNIPAGIPFITGGQAGTDLNVKIKQISGKAFLEAFETLKGGGQITEREGQAAKDAMARLDRAQSEGEYIKALTELRGIAERGMMRAQGRLGNDAPQPAGGGNKRLKYNAETGELE